ncbi:DDE-type integrase/transposase/recombinase [Xanthomonas oryzae]|uniref:DDE-type integrase/transposase/recombinase n=1 Tax=Xanthomonas oryzae TaxID=347 RepID=UPI00103423C3|nr:DDE-type integrase/transposase/recombinase [Xanthomonas oryzae]QBH00945.1 hypothetical protein EYC56_18760 [Xanthomonas oryzae]
MSNFFNKDSLQRYLARHVLGVEARRYIEEAALGPSRAVGRTSYPAIAGEYQSLKMGTCINVESNLEGAFAVYLDFDDDVVGFYEQPPRIDCLRTYKNGTRRLSGYTPDFVVLSKRGPVVVQVKSEDGLQDKLKRSPVDWVKRGKDVVDLPAERAFASIGLEHRVVTGNQLDPTLIANYRLLLQAKLKAPAPDADLLRSCEKHLNQSGVCSLDQLARAIGVADLSPLLALIAHRRMHVDLADALLSVPAKCLVTCDAHLLNGDVRDAWQCLTKKSGASGSANAEVVFPIGAHLQRSLNALDKIRAGQSGRTQRRLIARIREARKRGESDLLAVAPHFERCGNRTPGRPPIVLAFCEDVIRSHWGSDSRPSPYAQYRIYRALAKEWHPDLRPVSHPTYRRILEELTPILARERGGNRAFNALQAPTAVEDRAFKADRPFQLASADHYLCDLHCIVMLANGMKYAQRPWLTLLRDCATDAVLAVWISFRAPSRRSCALVIRQCLRRHGLLPESIIVDQGPDFRSVFFSTLLAHCGIDLRFRPSGFPKFGSEAEKYFRQLKELWLSARPANCVSKEEVRAVSGSHRPERYACLTLPNLWEELTLFNDWINAYCAGSRTVSPASLMAEGLARFSCSGLRVPDDERFLIASAVDEAKYRLDPQRGLHIGHHHFWHPSLRRLAGRKAKKIIVRRDPEDPYRCFAHIDGAWVTCLASGENRYVALDPLQRVVESVLELDGDEARKAAKEDAEMELVKRLRQSNELASPTSLLPVNVSHGAFPDGSFPEQEDPFMASEAEHVVPVKTEAWR